MHVFALELMCQYYREKGKYARQKGTILKLFSYVQYDCFYEMYWDCKRHPYYGERDAMYVRHCFSERFVGKFSLKVVEMYWNEVKEFVGRGNTKHYGHVAGALKEIRDIISGMRSGRGGMGSF